VIVVFNTINKLFAKLRRWVSNTFVADWSSLSNQVTLLLSLLGEATVTTYDKEIEQLPITGAYQFPSNTGTIFMYTKDTDAYFYTPSASYVAAGPQYWGPAGTGPNAGVGNYNDTTYQFIPGKIMKTADFSKWNTINISKLYGITHKSVYVNGYIYMDIYKVPFGTTLTPISRKSSHSINSTATYMRLLNQYVDPVSPYGEIIDIATDDTDIYRISTTSVDYGDGAKQKSLYIGNAVIQKPISYMLPERPMDLISHCKYFYGHPIPINLNGVPDFLSVRACGLVYNTVLYVQIYNLLYKLTSTGDIDKIYKLSFPVTDMFVLDNKIHIISDRSIIKCNL
jgi:hypothetical protein